MRGAIAVVAVTAGAVIAAVIAGLATAGEHRTGGNNQPPQAFVADLRPGQEACQEGEFVPPETGSVEVSVGTFGLPGPPLEVSVGDASTGRRAGGYRDGWVRLPFRGPAAATPGGSLNQRVCVRNAGDTRLRLAGELTPPERSMVRVDGQPGGGNLAFVWRAAAATTWWSAASEVAHRVTYGKADFGPWTPLVLLVIVCAGAFALILRSARSAA